ncbi:amidohydrolase [Streptomyces sp. TRM 70361]|uniref:amidohydrolase n=1 Tax=Streptomyces sp. TRM 70361 TaxID=3116553 RepID=UPI002E7B8BAF|nr:amidohydrolase [Streptomyces sp. TRM 70361]MEE1941608.1 amidohydrolase [Streptomyces sp. TRM 70361]
MEPLVDQYGRGIRHLEAGPAVFETWLAAAVTGGGGAHPPRGTTFFDTRLGLAVRRWCPPLLGLEPHCAPVRYLARRRELGAYAAGRALLRGSGIGTFLVADGPGESPGSGDTARPVEDPALLAGAGRPAHRTVRLEPLADRTAAASDTVAGFVSGLAEAVHTASRTAAAFVCDGGFPADAPPEPGEVRRAAARRLRGEGRRTDPVLVRHLLWSALVTGRPLQLRCADPGPLAGFLRATAGLGPPVVLLPSAPHHRAAARLAAAFPHVYTDIGPRPAETMDEAPFGKLLFSTGARGLPELYVVAARLFTREMERLLSGWVEEGDCARRDARRIAGMVGGGTARRLYRLGPDTGSAGAAGD